MNRTYEQPNYYSATSPPPPPPSPPLFSPVPTVKSSVKSSGKTRSNSTSSQNLYLVPIAAVEFLILCAFLTMNILFRFVPSTRDSAALFEYSNVSLSLIDVAPYRPYFNYNLGLSENFLETGTTFGLTFSLPESAFFVPLFIVPLLLIFISELLMHLRRDKNKKMKVVMSVGVPFLPPVRRFLRFYFCFLLFGTIAGFFTSFIKLLVPIPRPHFYSVCTLDTQVAPPSNFFLVGDFCSNPSTSDVIESLMSFPSYHATMAIYATFFLGLYLHHIAKIRGLYSVSVVSAVPIVVMGLIGALHRWVTYHNTWFDIIWGSVIGLAFALFGVYGMLNKFQENAMVEKIEENSEEKKMEARGSHVNEAFEPSSPVPYSNNTLRSPLPQSRPYQSYNPNVVIDDDLRKRNYNMPGQRKSMPAFLPRAQPPRPASAHPTMNMNSRGRHESSSYF